MNEIQKAWLLAKPYIEKLITDKGFWISFIFLFFCSFLYKWDSKNNLLTSILFSKSFKVVDAKTGFNMLFYDFYIVWWYVILFIFVLSKILFPLKNSFTISETLWIKFNQTSNLTLAISRIIFILGSSVFLFLVSCFWMVVFCLFYQTPLDYLYIPILGLIAQVILSTSLVLWLCSYHKLRSDFSVLLSIAALIFPVFLKFLLKSNYNFLGDFFPHTMPLVLSSVLPSTRLSYFSALILGVFLIVIYFLNQLKRLRS